jgi:hypothetical protein
MSGSSSVATSRLHVSRQQIAPLPVGALFFLLLTTLSRWNSVIVSLPTNDGDSMNSSSSQAEEAENQFWSQAPDTHQFPSRVPGKLRFDWTNMTLSSDLAKRIHVHQNNCSLPLAPNGTLYPYGLGSSLHSWSNGACGDLTQGVRTWTTNTAKAPWIWLDETKCDAKAVSPLSCYFPSMELQCPNDVVAPSVIGKRKSYWGCADRILGNNTSSDDNMSALRAATTEYLFRNVSRVVIDERQLRLVFPEQGVVPPKLITVHLRWGDKIIAEMKKSAHTRLYQWSKAYSCESQRQPRTS